MSQESENQPVAKVNDFLDSLCNSDNAAEFLQLSPATGFFRSFTESSERKKQMEVRQEVAKFAMTKQSEKLQAGYTHVEIMKRIELEAERAKSQARKCLAEGCGAYFETAENFQVHYQQSHTGNMFPCPMYDCTADFINSRDLLKHIERAHTSSVRSNDGNCTPFNKNPTDDGKSPVLTMSSTSNELKNIAALRTTATIELDKLQSEFGKFSYFLWRGKLVVHLEDERARQNRDSIIAAVNEIAQSYLQGQESVSVEVSSASLNACLCSPRIGSTIAVNHYFQAAGMYVVHGGVVHWVSVAHNYVRPLHLVLHQAASNENCLPTTRQEIEHPGIYIDFGDDPLLAKSDSMVLSSMPYPSLKHKPRDRMGRSLLHSVDIMIGQLPMVARSLKARAPENLTNLFEVRGRDGLIYRILKVLRPMPFVGNEHENCARYDITLEDHYERTYKKVTALLPGNNLAEGIIEPSFGTIYLNGESYYNVMFISSTNGVSPRYGDSGSIWVVRDTSEAVAITVGKMSVPGVPSGEVWVAILLFPCLEVLCLEHQRTLGDVSQITLLDGHSLMDD